VRILQGPLVETPGGAAERRGMDAFTYFNSIGGVPWGNPSLPREYYYFMSGRWRDGSPFRFGGTAFSNTPGEPYPFVYPGEVYPQPQYWSEFCPQPNCAQPVPPDDRRFQISTGPFSMQPGDRQEIVFAIVYSRGESNLHSVHRLKHDSDFVRRAFDLGLLDPPVLAPVEPQMPVQYRASRAHPNPFSSGTTIRFELPEASHVRLAVYDVLGREVLRAVDSALPAGEHRAEIDGSGLAPGIYFYRLEAAGASSTGRITRVR
jgi:hypothetical protein